MKHLSLKLAVLGTLGMVSVQAFAFGVFETLPSAGFAVTGGTSAYKILNDTGNFGSGVDITPSAGFHDVGATAPAGNNSNNPPAPYGTLTLAGAATGIIVVNNTYTNNTNVTVGQWNNRLWRNSTGTNCVYGYNIVNTLNSDYQPSVSGIQNIEFNDIAYGGFGTLPVDAAYWKQSGASGVVYRVGRTYSAVQHRGTAAGYYAQPLTTPAFTGSINGVIGAGTPAASQQSASINTNWVDFTTIIYALNDEGVARGSSSWIYVHTNSCPTGTPTTTANAVRLRQTSRNGGPFIEVAVPAYIPPGGNVLPAPVSPY